MVFKPAFQIESGRSSSSNDNKWSLTNTDGAMRLWRTETGSLHTTLVDKLKSPVVRSAFSPNDRIALAQLESGEILAYPSVDWTITKPEENWEDLLESIEGLDAAKARAWLDNGSVKKP